MNAPIKLLTCKLLGLTEAEYEMQLFEAAFQFLDIKLSGDPEGQQMLAQGRHFWKWWTLQWERRSKIILHNFNYTDVFMNPSEAVRKRARVAYNSIHKVDSLNILISRTIMRDTFQKVVKLEKSATH